MFINAISAAVDAAAAAAVESFAFGVFSLNHSEQLRNVSTTLFSLCSLFVRCNMVENAMQFGII